MLKENEPHLSFHWIFGNTLKNPNKMDLAKVTAQVCFPIWKYDSSIHMASTGMICWFVWGWNFMLGMCLHCARQCYAELLRLATRTVTLLGFFAPAPHTPCTGAWWLAQPPDWWCSDLPGLDLCIMSHRNNQHFHSVLLWTGEIEICNKICASTLYCMGSIGWRCITKAVLEKVFLC